MCKIPSLKNLPGRNMIEPHSSAPSSTFLSGEIHMKYCMDIRSFVATMEQVAPPELAEEYDAGKIGLVVEGRMRSGPSAVRSTPHSVWWRLPLAPAPICWSSIIRLSGTRSRWSGAGLAPAPDHPCLPDEPLCDAHKLRPCRRRRQRRSGIKTRSLRDRADDGRACRRLLS